MPAGGYSDLRAIEHTAKYQPVTRALIAEVQALRDALGELLAACDDSPGAVATADAVNHAHDALARRIL